MKRKGGASSSEPSPRPFSKKQMKRKAKLRVEKSERYLPKKEKLKQSFQAKQFQNVDAEQAIDKATSDLMAAVRDAMLPDGFEAPQKDEGAAKASAFSPSRVMRYLQSLGGDQGASSASDMAPRTSIDSVAVNRALVAFSREGDEQGVASVLGEMARLGVRKNVYAYTALMSHATKCQQYERATQYFDEMVAAGVEPTVYSWTALVNNKAKARRPDEALQTIDQLARIGVQLSTEMFVPVLQAFVQQGRHEDARALWSRMHVEDIALTLESFTVMVQLCTRTRSPERALFFLDEMLALRIQPDAKVFSALFRAVAESPFWVKGYEGTLTDLMCVMEGQELFPTTEVYNSLIYAYGKAGDAAAAEFYLWEMRRKGLAQDCVTYSNVMYAYSAAQAVGAARYGKKGMYVKRPLYENMSEEDEAIMAVGPDSVNSMLSKRFVSEEKGSKPGREKHGLVNAFAEGEEEAEEAMMREIDGEARRIHASRDYFARLEGGGGDGASGQRLLPAGWNADEGESDGQGEGEGEGEGDEEEGDGEGGDMVVTAEDEAEFARLMASLESQMGGLSGDLRVGDGAASSRGGREDAEESPSPSDEVFAPLPSMLASLKTNSDGNASKKGELSNDLLSLLDGGSSALATTDAPQNLFSDAKIDALWDMVEFGRPPKTDYSQYYRERQQSNIKRAELLYKEMQANRVPLNGYILNNFLAVYTEAVQLHRVDAVLGLFDAHNVRLDTHTYKHLIRMYVRARDVPRAVELKAEAAARGISLTGSTYGILVESLTGQGKLVEAIKLFEETVDKKVKIPERYLRALRSRCKTLRIVHPDMPADPNQWAKDVRELRRATRHTSDSKVEALRSIVSFAK